ncbi:MAG: nuclear transport factor 2 family protein [Clostridia bacterium]
MEILKGQVTEIVNRETKAWDMQDVELLLSVFHEDMVWPWPPSGRDHDPINWVMEMGRFDYNRWKEFYSGFFEAHKLITNQREIKKIEISKEGDGAFAVVDIDTRWENRSTGEVMYWEGRVCKVYSKVGDEWKMTMHTGVLKY